MIEYSDNAVPLPLVEQAQVSVIIPVFNAAKTLAICCKALASQTYQTIEIIFVNDCSTDDSLTLLEAFAMQMMPRKNRPVIILEHPLNKGVAEARNTGLDYAQGEYIYFVDADDSLEPDAISRAIQVAQAEQADIVGFDWFLSFEKNKRLMRQPHFEHAEQALSQMLAGSMRWNLWLFLLKRSLFEKHHIRFIPGMNMGEDLLVMVKLFSYAARVTHIPMPLYSYRQSNQESLTKVYSAAHMQQVSSNVAAVEEFLNSTNRLANVSTLILFLKLNIKLPLLISDKRENYRTWVSWFAEANPYVMENKALAYRTRLLQKCAVAGYFTVLQLYYHIVIRFVYGILYK